MKIEKVNAIVGILLSVLLVLQIPVLSSSPPVASSLHQPILPSATISESFPLADTVSPFTGSTLPRTPPNLQATTRPISTIVMPHAYSVQGFQAPASSFGRWVEHSSQQHESSVHHDCNLSRVQMLNPLPFLGTESQKNFPADLSRSALATKASYYLDPDKLSSRQALPEGSCPVRRTGYPQTIDPQIPSAMQQHSSFNRQQIQQHQLQQQPHKQRMTTNNLSPRVALQQPQQQYQNQSIQPQRSHVEKQQSPKNQQFQQPWQHQERSQQYNQQQKHINQPAFLQSSEGTMTAEQIEKRYDALQLQKTHLETLISKLPVRTDETASPKTQGQEEVRKM
ncbi:unnamed protein product [Protopolystoma xenopodis]|uniref:Uncharacterized protein n=1 Tax=Protopolystoma xenopodis TaxID=117903 RepID=A0A448WQJ5_9PLAT|nr:unnamed protein product [Protopolystoma xenopodis]